MNDLLDQLEREARAEALRLETNGQLPAGFTERYYGLAGANLREHRRLSAALAAATDATTFCALARGEAVPAHRLQQQIIRGHKRRAA